MEPTNSYLTVRRDADSLELDLTGEWRALQLAEIDAALKPVDLAGVRHVVIATDNLTALDLSGAYRLHALLGRARESGAEVSFKGTQPDQLRLIDKTLEEDASKASTGNPDDELLPVAQIGRGAIRRVKDLRKGLAFLGRTTLTVFRALFSIKRMRPTSIARHVYDTGITAIPIVSLIAFLISVIIAYMSAQQLISFGAEIFVVDLVTIGVLRELGVLLTAIIVAGRSGSAFAAEIGSMQLNEEVDALHAIGVNPFEVLVAPRVIGLVIALPLLTVISDGVGLAGGAILCRYMLDMPISQYISRVNEAISPTTFWAGLLKAPFFAMLIAMAGVHRGMQVRGSSRELGRLTTMAVVQSIFLVIFADAIFAVIFMELDF